MNQGVEHKFCVLLLDEKDNFLRAATDFLEREDELIVVGTTEGEAEALVQAQNLQPRVVVLDPSLPGGGDLEIIRRWRKLLPDVRIIVLTLIDSSTYRLASLAAGADEFVSKATLVIDLLPALRRVTKMDKLTEILEQESHHWYDCGRSSPGSDETSISPCRTSEPNLLSTDLDNRGSSEEVDQCWTSL